MDKERKINKLVLLATLIGIGIFISDIFTPRGIADGVSYIAVVLLTLWMRGSRFTFIFAVASTLLTLVGAFFSEAGEGVSVFFTNRILSLLGVWAAAFLILKFKKTEAAAARVKENLNALFDNATVGITLADKNGRITMMNPQAEAQFGYSRGELVGRDMEWILKKKLISESLMKSYLKSSVPVNLETEVIGKKYNGSEFPVEIKLSSYLLNDELYFIVFTNDITERKKQQDELFRSHEEIRQYAETLKEANTELENFAYISSHDLQEPLRKIQSFGDRLKLKEADNLNPESLQYIDRMLNAAGRMQRLINDLLAFSRLTSHAREFEKINLNQLVSEVLSDLEVTVERANAQVHLVSSLPVISGDPTQMRQLFQNLISNSIKFRKDNVAPVIKIYCTKDLRAFSDVTLLRNQVAIIVEDNGVGFNEKYLDKIFAIFQRLEAKKYEGSGIGLAICKKIVQRHNGGITARSQEGVGTKFIITLPIDQSAALPDSTSSTAIQSK